MTRRCSFRINTFVIHSWYIRIIAHALFRRARSTISIQSAWDTQCKHVYKILASSSKLVYQVTHGDCRWSSLEKDKKEREFYDGILSASFSHWPSGIQHKRNKCSRCKCVNIVILKKFYYFINRTHFYPF